MAVRETPSPHSHPPLSSPVGSRVRSEDAMPSPAPPAQPWSQVSVAPHTQTPLRDGLPFESGPWAPLRCPTAGTSMSPLVPLVRPLGAWLELPRPSRWLLRTIRLGYTIQFARRPPKFRGNRFTSVLSQDAPVLRAEVAVLLAKDAIQPAPPAEMESGLYKGPYFIVPKKHGGLHPIWDLRVLNRALVKLPFKMLTQRRLFQCVRPFDWVAAIDLKDAYFHVSILPRFRFAYKGASIPVGPPLRAPQPVGASGQPGKEQTLPYAEDLFSRQGVGLGQPHSTSLRGACSVNAEMPGVSSAQEGGSTETFSEAPGAYGILSRYHAARIASYETASALASRPSPEMGMAPRHVGSHSPRPAIAPSAHGRTLLSSGRSSPRASIQACCCFNRRLCHGLGGPCATGTQPQGSGQGPSCSGISIASSCWQYGLLCAASERCYTRSIYWSARTTLRPLRTSTTKAVYAPVACRNSPAISSFGVRSIWGRFAPFMSQASSIVQPTSSHVSTPFRENGDSTPRYSSWFGDASGRSGRPVCLPGHVSLPVVFLPVRGDPRYRCTGMQLASGLTQICVSPSEPSRTDPVQGQGGRGASPLGCALLAQSDVVPRTDAPRDSPSLANSSEEGSTFSERGHPLAPAPRLVESPRMVLGRDAEVLSGLPPAVVNTITSARALSTRQAYRLKWNLFVDWCSPRREDPRRCPIAVVLSFLQDGLERRLSPSTLKVYVAAIAAHHDAVDGKSLGKHDLVIRFLRGARRLNPPRPHLVPSWDLPSVLAALRGAPFEPLQSVELKFLSLKTVLLSALATVKRVRDLQAFSVDDSCLEFGPADSHVVLRPRPGYVPKVPTMPFRDQVVNLQALPREEADPAIALLCPVRALRIYVDRTQSFRTSDQHFVCFGGQQKGRAVSKQRLAHWIVEAIVLAYQARRLPCPLGVRAHSTRGVASSWALARGASIADICKAAGWATPNTFARFYNLRIEPVSSRVLVSDGQ